MKNNFLFLLCLLIPLASFCAINKKSSLFPENLRCEYLTNPKGLDELLPRFSWTLSAIDSDSFGQRQTAYRILVASSTRKLEQDKGDMWDSGWVVSSKMQNVEYGVDKLGSDRNYFWKLSVKDEEGRISNWSSPAHWSTGLLKVSEWKANWIGSKETFDPNEENSNINDPWFRKTFELNSKPGKATMFVASIGYHEVYVNGKKVGEEVLSPGVTDHTKRARYVAYNIEKNLKSGKNIVAIWLGTSWSIFGPYTTPNRPKTPIVIAQATIYNQRIPKSDLKPAFILLTDESWKTHPSPNKLLGTWATNAMGGELWDANKEIDDWNLESYNDRTYKFKVTLFPNPLTTYIQEISGIVK